MLSEEVCFTSSGEKVSLEHLTCWLLISVLLCDWFKICTHFSAIFSPRVYTSGRHCESVIDVCPRKPCQNGGTCAVASNMPDGFICQCPPVSTTSWNWIAYLISGCRHISFSVLLLVTVLMHTCMCVLGHSVVYLLIYLSSIYLLSWETQGFQVL